MHNHKILNIARPNPTLQSAIGNDLGISPLLAQILINRGIKKSQEAERFLNSKLAHLLDPFSFSQMHLAVALIKKAAKNKEKVLIFGDYDVDGITALTLLETTLLKMGLDVMHYVPHRIKEGYGLSKNILQVCRQKKIKLLITVDCGINDHEQIKQLRKDKIEVIVTDHHEPLDGERKSPASAVLNPKVKGCTYKFRDLAGVGVAYKLAQAVTGKTLDEDLDLVSIGTISDVVPLTGENRIIAREGLSMIPHSRRPGLQALMEVSGIKGKKMSAYFVSYVLGPRINASGRIDTAETSINLLLSDNDAEALKLAQIVHTHNRQRQKIESQILEEAQDLIDKEINFKEHKVIVIAKEDWHEGVLGVVASKLADRFYRPTIVLSLTDDLCRGSGRSIKNFHLLDALIDCQEHLHTFGGHSHAAGLVITRENIDDFKNSINRLAQAKLRIEDLLPSLDIDLELNLSDLNKIKLAEFEALEPFGKGNPQPQFYTRNLKLKSEPQILGRDTLKFWVTDGSITYPAIGFSMAGSKESVEEADSLDLVYSPRIDNWEGEESIILEVEDIFMNRGA